MCAEHSPDRDGTSLHAASCHACLFAPETSCERGNKYLDRSVLVETVDRTTLAFFELEATDDGGHADPVVESEDVAEDAKEDTSNAFDFHDLIGADLKPEIISSDFRKSWSIR